MFGGVILEELSFFDKLHVLWDNILDHPLFVVIFFIPILLFFLQKRHGKKVFIISYFLAIFILLIAFGDVIFKLFDNLVDGLFMLLYFPNFVSLFFIVLVSSLIALVCLFSKNINRISKAINYIAFGIIQSLFALILIVVRVHKVNIYKTNSLYSDKDILALMQLLTFVFVVELISILIVFIINKITSFLDGRTNFPDNINKQINDLALGKVEHNEFDNDKTGFINVADKSVSSIPKLIPFKFDIDKLQSIMIDVPTVTKKYLPVNLNSDNFSYGSEIIPVKLFKPFVINNLLPFYLNVLDKPYKSFSLNNSVVTYLNEKIVSAKYKPASLDSTKFIYLDVPKKGYKVFDITNDNFSYLNEVVKNHKLISLDSTKMAYLDVPKKSYSLFEPNDENFSYLNEIVKNYKITSLDSSKVAYLNIPKKDYKLFALDDKDVTYLNEVVKKPLVIPSYLNSNKLISIDVPSKGYKMAYIDTSKNVELLSSEKSYKRFNVKDKFVSYLNEIINKKKFKSYDVDFDKHVSYQNNSKEEYDSTIPSTEISKPEEKVYDNYKSSLPDLSNKTLDYPKSDVSYPVIEPIITFPRTIPKHDLISNLKIIDIQSMLDVASKYHFMKGVNLGTYSKMTVENLKICNFKLLADTLRLYKLFK